MARRYEFGTSRTLNAITAATVGGAALAGCSFSVKSQPEPTPKVTVTKYVTSPQPTNAAGESFGEAAGAATAHIVTKLVRKLPAFRREEQRSRATVNHMFDVTVNKNYDGQRYDRLRISESWFSPTYYETINVEAQYEDGHPNVVRYLSVTNSNLAYKHVPGNPLTPLHNSKGHRIIDNKLSSDENYDFRITDDQWQVQDSYSPVKTLAELQDVIGSTVDDINSL